MTATLPGLPLIRTALVLGPLLMLASNTSYAVMTAGGGSDGTAAGDLALASGHPQLYLLGTHLGTAACLLLVPAVWAAAQHAYGRSPRLATVGGWLTATGYVLYLGQLSQGLVVHAVATRPGVDREAFAAVMTAGSLSGAAVAALVVLAVSSLLGPVLLGWGLVRGGRRAAIGLVLWTPLHVAGLLVGQPWIEVLATVGLVVGLAGLSRQIEVRPSPGDVDRVAAAG